MSDASGLISSEIDTAGRVAGKYGLILNGWDAWSSSDAHLRDLADLLFSHRFVVLDDQTVDIEKYASFGRRWGDPVILIASKNRRPDYPEVIMQSNSLAVPEPVRNVASHWHCDSSYEDVAATVTMLLGVKAPASGGETLFADMVAAFDDLPAGEQTRLETLQVRHAVSAAKPAHDEIIVRPQDLPAELSQGTRVPDPVIHPLVRAHPVTGRKALYGLGGSAFGIVGMEAQAGAALIADLKRHATQDHYIQSHKLRPGELLLWDNFSVMHRATPIVYSDAEGSARLNFRISLKGLPGFLDT